MCGVVGSVIIGGKNISLYSDCVVAVPMLRTINLTQDNNSNNLAVFNSTANDLHYRPLSTILNGLSGTFSISGATISTTNGLVTSVNQSSTQGISVYKSGTDGTNITGTTSNSVTYTQLIPASTMTTDSLIRVNYRVRTTINSATTIRIYVNTTAGLTGSPVLVGQFNNGGATSFLVNSLLRTLVVKNSSNNTEVYTTSGLTPTDQGLYNSISTLVINWAVDQYFVFAVQNSASVSQNARGSYYLIEKI
jgi:hypothetical protein